MRNNPWPIILVLLTVAGALVWLHFSPIAEPGAEGPRFQPGIFRLPKDERKMVQSAEVVFTSEPFTPEKGEWLVCPPEQWRVIVVRAVSHQPIASSVALALAEEFTRRGSIVILSTPEAPPFPMPADMSITVDVVHPGSMGVLEPPPSTRDLFPFAIEVVWRSATGDWKNQGGDPSGNLAEDASSRPGQRPWGTELLDYRIQARDGTHPSWSAWFAALGRHVAQDIIRRGTNGSPIPLVDAVTGRWSADLLPMADWNSILHLPPQCDGLEWHCPFQEELVRGWTGFFKAAGKDAHDRTVLLRRLTNGQWQQGADDLHWSRTQEGVTTHVRMRRRDDGYAIIHWQDRTDGAKIIHRWLQDLDGTDLRAARIARRQLSRYQRADIIPADLRRQIAASLGPKASAE